MPLFLNDPWELFSTKEFSYEEALLNTDELNLEGLRALTSARRVAVELRAGHATDAKTAGERALEGLEKYIPLLENFTQRVEIKDEINVEERKGGAVSFFWSSPLGDNVAKPRYYKLKLLQMERAMVLNLYAIAMRKRASELVVGSGEGGVEALASAATLFRRAAGVYDYLARDPLPLLKEELDPERPAELMASMAEVMSLVCLAESQAVAVHRAELKGSSPKLVASLHAGVGDFFDRAATRLRDATGDFNDIQVRLKKFIALGASLHMVRAYKAFASGLAADGECGQAMGVLSKAMKHHRDCMMVVAEDERWMPFCQAEGEQLREDDAKYNKENEHVYFQHIPEVLPPLPEKKAIVTAVEYTPPEGKVFSA